MDRFILMPLWHRVWGFHPPYIKQPGLTRIVPFPQPHPPPAAFVAAKAEEGRQRRSTTGPRRRRVDEAMSWWFSGSLVYGGLTACQQGDTVFLQFMFSNWQWFFINLGNLPSPPLTQGKCPVSCSSTLGVLNGNCQTWHTLDSLAFGAGISGGAVIVAAPLCDPGPCRCTAKFEALQGRPYGVRLPRTPWWWKQVKAMYGVTGHSPFEPLACVPSCLPPSCHGMQVEGERPRWRCKKHFSEAKQHTTRSIPWNHPPFWPIL